MNVADLLRASAQSRPDKDALVLDTGGSIPFGRVDAEADRVAHGLSKLGVEPGDRVALAMHNVPHFVYAYFGILRAGVVAVPLNVMLTAHEVASILADSGAKAVLGAPPFGNTAREAATETGVAHIVLTDDWDSLGPLGEPARAAGISSDELAVLAYTSGTTAEPKGAMLTHGNLLANIEQQMSIPDARVEPDDVLLLALPLSHIFGLNVTLGLLARTGASGVLLEAFDPISCLEAIARHGVTVMFGAPTMYHALVNTPGADQYDLSSVRLAISGAAPLSPQTLTSFRDLFGIEIDEGYGLTETAPTLTSNRMGKHPKPRSVGKPLPGVELRLVDERGNDVELGDPGEVIVRGPNVFKGYWNREDETARAFLGDWFRTGDIAIRDEDGYLYLVDRKRDLVIVSGFNVFPAEVEDALRADPRVADAAVVGVPHAYTGEAIKAYVVLEEGAESTEADLLSTVAAHLARFKCPRYIEIVDTLPHLVTGKVLRRALRNESSPAPQASIS